MGYRLQGYPVDRLCVKHLSGALRVVVVFESRNLATIVLFGPHDNSDPNVDVYTQLYELAGISAPTGERTKPHCCDRDGNPPDGSDLADELVESIRAATRIRRRRL